MNAKKLKAQVLLASLLASGSMWGQTANAPFIMKTGMEYYVCDISANGKWACGAYLDYNNSSYGFRWNLETDEIEMLDTSNESSANAISDDGIVAGKFVDYTYKTNGASTTMAGYWKDNKWNRIEMPSGATEAQAVDISPDGRYISGKVSVNGESKGYVWEDGKLIRELKGMGYVVTPYAVSPDGQYAAGWVWDKDYQRRAVMWTSDGSYKRLNDFNQANTEARKFTPDGKNILYAGGWPEDKNGAYAIYNIETGESSTLPTYGLFMDISNDKTVVGIDNSRACIWWPDGTMTYADDYLKSKGVDLDAEGVFQEDELGDYYQIERASAISADSKVMNFDCYHTEGKQADGTTPVNTFSMITRFGVQQERGLAPLSVAAKAQYGTSSVIVSWKPNVLADDITGYNIYRDGTKVNASPVTTETYADTDVPNGDHKYTVTALYDSDESAKSDEAAVTVKAADLQTPNAIFAQQHSYNNAYLSWTAPNSNYASLGYFDKSISKTETFGYGGSNLTIELAVKFDETTLAAYKGKKIRAVDFTPLEEQGGWGINFYTYDAAGKLKPLYSQSVTQELSLGSRNTVKLDTPVDIPETGELVIATEVKMTTPSGNVFSYQNGYGKNGYTDLLRMKTEPDFYSFGDGMESRMYMFRQTWDINAVVSSEDDNLALDNVASYNIYDGDKLVANSTEKSYELKNLTAGTHNLGITAVYANGKESEKSVATLDITPDDSQLAAVDEVSYKANGNTMSFEWAPVKGVDKARLQYSVDEPSKIQGINVTDGYNEIQYSVLFAKNMMKGRDGYEIRSFRFFPTGDATFTAYIQQDNETVQEYEIDNYELNEWNEYTLSTPIKVSDNSSYRLIIDCYDFSSGSHSIGMDNTTNLYGYSDVYRMSDGSSWVSTAESLLYGNWMMGLDIVNPNAEDIEATGYDVNIDNVKQNAEPLTKTSFDYEFATVDTKWHTVTVDAYYPVKAESVKGGITRFNLGTLGVEENVIQTINIQKGENEICVNGDNVNGVEIYSAAGAKVAGADGNVVSINGLATGSYVVKANVAGKTVSRKIMINK